MKQIRMGVFETNSSSTHSIVICTKNDYNKWANGDVYLHEIGYRKYEFVTRAKAIEQVSNSVLSSEEANLLKTRDVNVLEETLREFDYFTYENWFRSELEEFAENWVTPQGEEIVAFGYYGYDA